MEFIIIFKGSLLHPPYIYVFGLIMLEALADLSTDNKLPYDPKD